MILIKPPSRFVGRLGGSRLRGQVNKRKYFNIWKLRALDPLKPYIVIDRTEPF
ncbi:hypothetical protein PITCH_A1800011 [uncultured Desulfobacterium sp.]|uniref:Uncharacterized protein n=1 Tax=uncultured Desulfobacterium sp. TaxID=201089 RepID=A0A445MV23_9BACT|nr:hypothetical protein PITCH_A1800011 [uncultured Desulfobacterium sp.]